jgi:hypothetical protein
VEATSAATPEATAEINPADPPPALPQSEEGSIEYAVIGRLGGEPLDVRDPAGISSSLVDTLPMIEREILLTGKSTLLGSSRWVQIYRPSGATGWVNAFYLTEYIPAQRFCADPRVLDLQSLILQSIAERDARKLGDLVSPWRGLSVRYHWQGPTVVVPLSEVSRLFKSQTAYTWGLAPETALEVEGTFSQALLPLLDDVLASDHQLACNSLILGLSGKPVAWPAEYANLNFYSYYREAQAGRSPYGWRTWALGIEYVDGRPYLGFLIHYQGEF